MIWYREVIDLELPYKGDKRIFGWDDYPHEGVEEIKDIEIVIKRVSEYLKKIEKNVVKKG